MAKLTKADVHRTWEDAAPGWATWEDVVASGFRGATARMLELAAGARVLDLACGAGSQTFQAAERVGADGAIVASDISPTMLSHVSVEVESEVVQVRLTLESADSALQMMQGAFGVYRAAVAELDEQRRKAAWSEVREFIGRFDNPAGWEAELEVRIGAGATPR